MESPGSFSDGHSVGCSFLCSSSIPRGALVLLPAPSAVLDGGCGLAILFIASFVSSPLSRFFIFIFSTSIVLRTEPFLHGLYKAACSRLIHVLLCHLLHSPFVILATKTKKIPAELLAYILVAPLFLYLAGLGSRFCAISSQS